MLLESSRITISIVSHWAMQCGLYFAQISPVVLRLQMSASLDCLSHGLWGPLSLLMRRVNHMSHTFRQGCNVCEAFRSSYPVQKRERCRKNGVVWITRYAVGCNDALQVPNRWRMDSGSTLTLSNERPNAKLSKHYSMATLRSKTRMKKMGEACTLLALSSLRGCRPLQDAGLATGNQYH